MTRPSGLGDLTYQFQNHFKKNGVGRAASFDFFIGSEINILSISRAISINTVNDEIYGIDNNIKEETARVDTSEMSVDKISENAHLVGTGNAYSLFVDAGDHIIAVGGYAGLQTRFDAYQQAASHDKPLRYQVVTHHHTDHLGGMAEAFALGATFITPENAIANLTTAAGEPIPNDRLQIIDGMMMVGPLEIYDIWTSHAESYALAYLPDAKTVFQADHYNGTYSDGPSPAGSGAVTLHNAIQGLELDVNTLLSAHGRKAISWSAFEAAVTAYDPASCPSGRAICK